jgi:hypothetical protein
MVHHSSSQHILQASTGCLSDWHPLPLPCRLTPVLALCSTLLKLGLWVSRRWVWLVLTLWMLRSVLWTSHSQDQPAQSTQVSRPAGLQELIVKLCHGCAIHCCRKT